jgi:hypothetical protein
LQDRLHELLTKLAACIEHVKNWPGDEAAAGGDGGGGGDDDDAAPSSSVHAESTSGLIRLIREVVALLRGVERAVRDDADLERRLRSCPVPLDLLELLDQGLNPDCFSRGLLREALGQLQGLKRRKVALTMLGKAVQAGINKKREEETGGGRKQEEEETVGGGVQREEQETVVGVKRDRGHEDEEEQPLEQEEEGDAPKPAPKKKLKIHIRMGGGGGGATAAKSG